MKRLWLYFPENDLALAAGTAGYTPPPAARELHQAGELLPLWMAATGDRVLCSGVDARWLDDTCRRFAIRDVDVYDHRCCDLDPAPWGWSEASCRALADGGFPARLLPDSASLARLRDLSHRRTASLLAERLAAELPFDVAPPAVEAADEAAVAAFFDAGGDVIAKSPWSSSGRGLVRSRCMPRDAFLKQTAGIIRRQGSVMLEREYDKVLDFAMLFHADGRGGVEFRGLSLFATTARGAYTSNVLAPQPALRAMIADRVGEEHLGAVQDALARVLPEVAAGYSGPLGVDMLLASDGLLDCAVELNLRYTMGFVALSLAPHLAPGSEGTLAVVPRPAAPASGLVQDAEGRVVEGELDLTPPHPAFAFRLTARARC